MSPHDSQFREFLTEDEFRAGGIDKSNMLRTARILTSFGTGFLLRPLLRKGPPFYYCNEFPVEESRYILRALTSSRLYQTAENEYRLAHQPEYIEHLEYSIDAIHAQSDDAAHYIHLSDWELVQRLIVSCLKGVEA